LHLIHIGGTELDPRYQALAISNGDRQFQFLESIVATALSVGHLFLSHDILRALNFHAIACLHPHAGQYRPCEVEVRNAAGGKNMDGVPFYNVQSYMDHFLNGTNAAWNSEDPVALAAQILWSICRIHPFVNGNGRTARAACYYAICVKFGGMLPGTKPLPVLLKEHPNYVPALQHADQTAAMGAVDFSQIHTLIADCLTQQVGP
jgi:Fic family protein